MNEAASVWPPPLLVEGCRAQLLELPTREELHLAVFGKADTGLPVCSQGYWLRRLHHRRRTYLAIPRHVIDCARADYITDIDRWVTRCVRCPAPGARVALASVGVLVDRIAEHADRAMDLIETGPASPATHQAWNALACAELAYVDLVSAATQGRIRLPAHPPLKVPDARE
ncbi:hypothetical protein ACWDYH_02505 [Nocardia goodfellowii]